MLFRRFRAWWRHRQYEVAMGRLRDSLAVLGIPVHDLTDAEIEAAIRTFQDKAALSGVSAEEAEEAYAVLRDRFLETA